MILEGDDEDDQVIVGIFNIIQENPNTGVHLKVDEAAVEGCTGKSFLSSSVPA